MTKRSQKIATPKEESPHDEGQPDRAGIALQATEAAAEGPDAETADPGADANGGIPNGRPLEDYPIDEAVYPIDEAVFWAEEGAYAALRHLGGYFEHDNAYTARLALLAGNDHSRATNAIANLVRHIGRERATPAVAAQQLKILGLIDDPELSEAEILMVSTFINLFAEFEAFQAAMAQRFSKTEGDADARPPIPIEDTTMDVVDGTMETFGGRG